MNPARYAYSRTPSPTLFWVGCGIVGGLCIALGIAPVADRGTWLLENAPVLLAGPVLIATRPRFAFTPLAYLLIAVHAVILMIGGHYSYAEVPLGHWVADALGLARNHYDRLGHVAQGFVPAIVMRELLLRHTGLERGLWLLAVVTLAALGISALYEILEWWTAALFGAGATAFLGTQGDVWDTQWDMFLCGTGALASLLLLRGIHDRQLGPP